MNGGDILARDLASFIFLKSAFSNWRNVFCISNHTLRSIIADQIKEAEGLGLTAILLAAARCIHWEAPASFPISRRYAEQGISQSAE